MKKTGWILLSGVIGWSLVVPLIGTIARSMAAVHNFASEESSEVIYHDTCIWKEDAWWIATTLADELDVEPLNQFKRNQCWASATAIPDRESWEEYYRVRSKSGGGDYVVIKHGSNFAVVPEADSEPRSDSATEIAQQ